MKYLYHLKALIVLFQVILCYLKEEHFEKYKHKTQEHIEL